MRIGDVMTSRLPPPSAIWRWWTGELAGLVPARLRQGFAGSRGRLVLAVTDHGLAELVRESSTRRERLGTVDLQALTQAAAGDALRTTASGREIAVRLPPGAALRTAIALPLAAERNLAQVVSFELERRTPLKRSDTYHAFRILKREPGAKRLLVELTVAPRRAVDDVMAALRRLGIEPRCVEVAAADRTETVSPNLLPGRPRQASPGVAVAVLSVLAVIALALATAAVAVPLYRLHQAADTLTAEVAEFKRQADEGARLQKEIDAAIAASGFLAGRKREAPVVSEILDGLTRLLPDDTWLTSLHVNGNEIEIIGQSASASALIGLIDRSAAFSNPSFRSPVMQDQRTNREQFNIAARVARGTPP